MSCPTIPKTACCFTLVAKQVERNVGAGELYLTDEEIGEIEGRNTYQPELVTAVKKERE
jgi:hypothetical protein